MSVRIVTLPKMIDPRGNLSFLQNQTQVPFDIKRTIWIYDVPGGETRGAHAYRTQCEIIIALSGSFDVQINHGEKIETYHLNRSYYGLYIPPMQWRQMLNFSTNSVALIVSDSAYNAHDYIRDINEFLKLKNTQ